MVHKGWPAIENGLVGRNVHCCNPTNTYFTPHQFYVEVPMIAVDNNRCIILIAIIAIHKTYIFIMQQKNILGLTLLK